MQAGSGAARTAVRATDWLQATQRLQPPTVAAPLSPLQAAARRLSFASHLLRREQHEHWCNQDGMLRVAPLRRPA